MVHFGTFASVAPAWLTAFMVLVANFPHFECRCANGNRKPYCLGLSDSCGCCCDGTCEDQKEDACPCCKHHKLSSRQSCCKSSDDSSDGRSFGRAGCTKTLADQQSGFTDDKPALPEGALVATPVAACPIAVALPSAFRSAQHFHGPPPDLVIAFHHFLI